MKVINNLFKDDPDITGILSQIEQIRTRSEVINVVFQATGSSWLGVNIAGRSMFPEATIEIPQYYSNQVISDGQIDDICKKIVNKGFHHFIFHGYAPYISKFIHELKGLDPGIRILLVHHGFVSELSDNELQIRSVSEIISLCRQGKIDKMGVVKVGHELLFSRLFGIPVTLLFNKVPVCPSLAWGQSDKKVNIGVLVNNTFRKNKHCQVMAGLLHENSIVHVIDGHELYYLDAGERIVEHGMLPHNEFLALLASMDINLHITYSESFGGQVFTESLGCGVPCLTGYSNGFLDFDPELKTLLSVSEADDPVAIHERIKAVLPMREQLREKMINYCAMVNHKADEFLNVFIND